MLKKIQEIDYVLPVHWAGPLINADDSGLMEGEAEEIQAWLNEAGRENGGTLICVEMGEPEFRWRNDANGEGGNVATFTFHLAGGGK